MHVRLWPIAGFALLFMGAAIGYAAGSVGYSSLPSSPHHPTSHSTPLHESPAQQSALAQTVVAQGKLISQLQTRISALEHASSTAHPIHATLNQSKIRKVTMPVPHSVKLTDLASSLRTLQSHHAAFLSSVSRWPGHIYWPTPGPTLSQVAAQEAQVAAQEAQLAQEITDLKNELSFDENYLYAELTTVRNNTNNLANQEASDIKTAYQLIAGCQNGLGTTWGNWKYYINNNYADNYWICSGKS